MKWTEVESIEDVVKFVELHPRHPVAVVWAEMIEEPVEYSELEDYIEEAMWIEIA